MMRLPIPFTPSHVSINRVQIVDLPGLPVDREVRGRKAYDLLSSRAVIHYAWEKAGALALPYDYLEDSIQTRAALPRYVSDCLQSSDARVQGAAQAIARRLGRNLGYILLTLHRGDRINQQARPDWTAADWKRWGEIQRIWLGGGLLSGQMGELIIQHACELLDELNYQGLFQVDLTPYRKAMALLGAGRYLPIQSGDALCLDFGQTLVKRSCLRFQDGILGSLHFFEPLTVDWVWLDLPGGLSSNRQAQPGPFQWGQSVLEFVSGAIVQTMQESIAYGPDLMLSIAAYVSNGAPLGNGLYAQMRALAKDVRPLIEEAIYQQTGQAMRVHLIHDGTAASTLHAGESKTAVLIVGTAIGVGFPPPRAEHLRPLAPQITFSYASPPG